MNSQLVFACCSAATLALLLGAYRHRSVLRGQSVADSLISFSPVLMAVPIAIFSMEHLFAASALSAIVPVWLLHPIFWTYLVGAALLLAALSFCSRIGLKWSASLLTLLFLTFVALIHVPNTVQHWRERLYWTLIARELLFAAGAFTFALSLWHEHAHGKHRAALQRAAGFMVAVILLFFACQHFLNTGFSPGVPLPKRTPNWVPFAPFWAYLVGAIYLASAYMFAWSRQFRCAALLSGCTLLALVLLLYVPILIQNFGTPQTVEGINYVADTLLAAAAMLMCGLNTQPLDCSALPSARNQGSPMTPVRSAGSN